MCEQCFFCRSIVLCQSCTKCHQCCVCIKYTYRGKTESVLGNLGGRSQSSTNVERRVHPTLPKHTKLDQVTHNHQLLCKSPQEPLPVGCIASADKQECNRVGQKSRISGFLQPAIFDPKAKQQMETYTRSEQSQQIPQGRKIQNGDARNDSDLPTDRGVGHVHRFQGLLLQHTHTNPIKEILDFIYRAKRTRALPFGLSISPLEFTVVEVKEVKRMALQKDIRIHQYLEDLLVRARSQIFDFVGYQFDLQEGKVRPTIDRWQTPRTKITALLIGRTCPVRQLMSLIGLLTGTEKLVHLG